MDNNYNSQQDNFNNTQQNGYVNNPQQGNAYYNQQQNGYMNNPQQNNGYYNPQQNYYMNNGPKDNSQTSKICGIASIVVCFIGWFCCIGYAGVPLAIIAIVFALQSKNNNGGQLNSDAKIGLITGIVGLGVMLLGFVIGFIIGFASVFAGM